MIAQTFLTQKKVRIRYTLLTCACDKRLQGASTINILSAQVIEACKWRALRVRPEDQQLIWALAFAP